VVAWPAWLRSCVAGQARHEGMSRSAAERRVPAHMNPSLVGSGLSLFGGTELRRGDGSSVSEVLAQPKRLALLTYLVCATPRGFHRRDTLLAMFWPESDSRHAGLALRQAIHQLRRALGDDVLVRRSAQEVSVDPCELACDAVRFEELLDQRREREALSLYAGPFMPGFHAGSLGDFERWLDGERDRLARRAARAALALGKQVFAAGEYDDAERWGEFACAALPGEPRVLAEAASLLRAAAAKTLHLESAGRSADTSTTRRARAWSWTSSNSDVWQR
jgi:hypothetical protein